MHKDLAFGSSNTLWTSVASESAEKVNLVPNSNANWGSAPLTLTHTHTHTMHASIHVHAHKHTHTHTNACKHACAHTHTHTHTHSLSLKIQLAEPHDELFFSDMPQGKCFCGDTQTSECNFMNKNTHLAKPTFCAKPYGDVLNTSLACAV